MLLFHCIIYLEHIFTYLLFAEKEYIVHIVQIMHDQLRYVTEVSFCNVEGSTCRVARFNSPTTHYRHAVCQIRIILNPANSCIFQWINLPFELYIDY